MGGVGPMFGQFNWAVRFAGKEIEDPRPRQRFVDEARRLLRVLDGALEGKEWIAGDYSIADMAIAPWAKLWDRQGQQIDEFPHAKRWLEAVMARPAVKRGIAVSSEDRGKTDLQDPAVRAVLFGQRAR